MVPEDFLTFFSVSAGASATLIGLLFIAISIEPARVFGSEARAEAQATAASAFTALANVFFVSLAALIPHIGLGILVLVMSAIALINTVQKVVICGVRRDGMPDAGGHWCLADL